MQVEEEGVRRRVGLNTSIQSYPSTAQAPHSSNCHSNSSIGYISNAARTGILRWKYALGYPRVTGHPPHLQPGAFETWKSTEMGPVLLCDMIHTNICTGNVASYANQPFHNVGVDPSSLHFNGPLSQGMFGVGVLLPELTQVVIEAAQQRPVLNDSINDEPMVMATLSPTSRTNLRENRRRFECARCERSYDRSSRADKCRNQHLGLKPYQCLGRCGSINWYGVMIVSCMHTNIDSSSAYGSFDELERHLDRYASCTSW